jgi:hypothetical protein
MCQFVDVVSAFDSTSQHVQPFVVLREVFSSFDYKNTGTVEVDELRHAFALYDKYSDEEIDQIFAAVVSFFLPVFAFVVAIANLPLFCLAGHEWGWINFMDRVFGGNN